MSDQQKISTTKEDEITLKDLIFKIKEFYLEILKNWIIVALVTIPIFSFFLVKAFMTPPVYPATLTFMVNEDEGGGVGGAMAILSQFGFGGGSSGGKYNLEKILELSKTRKIIHFSLFEKSTIKGKEDFLANHIIDIYKLHKGWKDSEELKSFYFSDDSLTTFDRVENTALKALYVTIIGSQNTPGFYSTSINDKTSIMSLKAISTNEQLSIQWLNNIYKHLSQYYIDKTIEKQLFTYNVVKEKVDSVKTELNNAEYRLANFKDSNRGIWTKVASLEEQRLTRKLLMLTNMYGESIKNLEIAEFSLKNKTPFIQLIDSPIAPIFKIKESKIKAIILGLFLGLFLSSGFIIIRRIIREAIR